MSTWWWVVYAVGVAVLAVSEVWLSRAASERGSSRWGLVHPPWRAVVWQLVAVMVLRHRRGWGDPARLPGVGSHRPVRPTLLGAGAASWGVVSPLLGGSRGGACPSLTAPHQARGVP